MNEHEHAFNLPASLRKALARLRERNRYREITDDPFAGYVDLPRWLLKKPAPGKLPLPRTITVDSRN